MPPLTQLVRPLRAPKTPLHKRRQTWPRMWLWTPPSGRRPMLPQTGDQPGRRRRCQCCEYGQSCGEYRGCPALTTLFREHPPSQNQQVGRLFLYTHSLVGFCWINDLASSHASSFGDPLLGNLSFYSGAGEPSFAAEDFQREDWLHVALSQRDGGSVRGSIRG